MAASINIKVKNLFNKSCFANDTRLSDIDKDLLLKLLDKAYNLGYSDGYAKGELDTYTIMRK